MSRDAQVLIEGAGPTGLVLALWLARIGVSFRIIDKAAAHGLTSRALAVHARTLEFYRQLGIATEVIEKGYHFPNVNIWVDRQPKAKLSLGETGEEISPFPFVLMFPQDQHEEFLITRLRKLGVEIERPRQLIHFESEDRGEGVRVRVAGPSGEDEEEFRVDYLAGCDGAHSFVREKLGTGFSGTTYPGLFYVADVVGRGSAFNGELHVTLDESEFLGVFPMKERGHARLIGVLREVDNKTDYQWSDVNTRVFKDLELEIDKVHWFSTYHVHHRVASNFQDDRVFLLGDAAHIHSPVGGQGMNTGIGDAVNLAWKLGEVLKGRASTRILETYESERLAFARRLVHTTDRVFQLVSARGQWAAWVRTRLAPLVLDQLFRLDLTKRFLFRTVSQTGISYRHSQLSRGEAGSLCGGDRLPWIASVDNFAPLSSLGWQVHLYGASPEPYAEIGAPLLHFPWNEEMARKGLSNEVAYVVRPDGHIGLITARPIEIERYFEALAPRQVLLPESERLLVEGCLS